MLHHYILRLQADKLRAVGLLFDDGLHDELTEGSALNAVNPKGYGNDKFEVIDIVVDMVNLFNMAAYIILSQDALLEYHLDSRT